MSNAYVGTWRIIEMEQWDKGPRSWDRPLEGFRGGLRGADGSSTDAKIAANIDRGF